MKRILSYIGISGCCILLSAGCGKMMDAGCPDGKTMVQVMLPGSYSIPASARPSYAQTKAEEHPDLNDGMLEPLDDGSTLWLAVYEKNADGKYTEKPTELQSYVVRRSGNGYSTLYTCQVNSDGSVKSESDKPLFLEIGKTYKFRAVSPARELIDDTRLHVKNGEYLLATDDRYTQTQAVEETIEREGSVNIIPVYLNPLLHQTARMSFSIEAGENVHRLDVLPAGVEIAGVQDDVLHDNLYNWMTTEPLEMHLGNKNSVVTIGGDDFTRDEHGCMVGQTALLPTDATSSSIIVLLSLSVNGVNSQFTMMLNDLLLEAAHSYNFKVTVKVENDITVAVWQSQSWGWDMELQSVGQK